jgi:hypothetical protein
VYLAELDVFGPSTDEKFQNSTVLPHGFVSACTCAISHPVHSLLYCLILHALYWIPFRGSAWNARYLRYF